MKSGRWEQRGRARDKYVMCRRNDTGPYSVSNVYIATLSHNGTVQPNNPYRKDHPDHAKVVPIVVAKQRAARAARMAA